MTVAVHNKFSTPFKMDGTLLDSEPAHAKAWIAAVKEATHGAADVSFFDEEFFQR